MELRTSMIPTERFQIYRELSKSGIVALVVISVLGGYIVGQPSDHAFSATRLAVTLLGVLLLASGSSALNQIQEHRIDAQMPRTAKRPLPSGRITMAEAVIFVLASVVAGLLMLLWVAPAIAWLGVAAVVSYNGLYTLWWKRRWAFAAIPGAVPGALPVLMGHAAASGRVWEPSGIYLFFILFYWQMPHFWVLALRYREDYRQGGIPTLPVALGGEITVKQIRIWSLGYMGLILIAPLFMKVGTPYLVAALATCAMILKELRQFMRAPDQSRAWLRFFLWVNFSLIIAIAAAAADLWGTQLISPYFR